MLPNRENRCAGPSCMDAHLMPHGAEGKLACMQVFNYRCDKQGSETQELSADASGTPTSNLNFKSSRGPTRQGHLWWTCKHLLVCEKSLLVSTACVKSSRGVHGRSLRSDQHRLRRCLERAQGPVNERTNSCILHELLCLHSSKGLLAGSAGI